MKKYINLGTASMIIYSTNTQNPNILFVPNGAGYYAHDKEGARAERYDKLCETLANDFNVFLAVLSGQDITKDEGSFSFDQGVIDIINACDYIVNNYGIIKGIFAMCGTPAMVVQAINQYQSSNKLLPFEQPTRMVFYFAPTEIKWAEEKTQEWFEKEYPVRLNKTSMKSAPLPGEVIEKFKGKSLTIYGENSIYPMSTLTETFSILHSNNDERETSCYLLRSLGDVPSEQQSSDEWNAFIENIKTFFLNY